MNIYGCAHLNTHQLQRMCVVARMAFSFTFDGQRCSERTFGTFVSQVQRIQAESEFLIVTANLDTHRVQRICEVARVAYSSTFDGQRCSERTLAALVCPKCSVYRQF